MFESGACCQVHSAEKPAVNCAALLDLKLLLHHTRSPARTRSRESPAFRPRGSAPGSRPGAAPLCTARTAGRAGREGTRPQGPLRRSRRPGRTPWDCRGDPRSRSERRRWDADRARLDGHRHTHRHAHRHGTGGNGDDILRRADGGICGTNPQRSPTTAKGPIDGFSPIAALPAIEASGWIPGAGRGGW